MTENSPITSQRYYGLPDLEWLAHAPGLAHGPDALLLAGWVPLQPGIKVLDLGCGQGVIALLLAAREKLEAVGLERENALWAVCREHGRLNRERLKGRVHWLGADLREMPFWPQSFDLVVMNPPYFRAGAARPSPDALRRAARQEIHGNLQDWLAAGRYALKEGGLLAGVFREERRAEWLENLAVREFQIVAEKYVPAGGAGKACCLVQARLSSSRSKATTSR